MSEPLPDVPPPAVNYESPRRRGTLQQSARFVGGFVGAFAILFIPTFFAGGSMMGGEPSVWWAWPAVIVAALACAAHAWLARRRNPPASAGVWFGIGVGLLVAGLCFSTA